MPKPKEPTDCISALNSAAVILAAPAFPPAPAAADAPVSGDEKTEPEDGDGSVGEPFAGDGAGADAFRDAATKYPAGAPMAIPATKAASRRTREGFTRSSYACGTPEKSKSLKASKPVPASPESSCFRGDERWTGTRDTGIFLYSRYVRSDELPRPHPEMRSISTLAKRRASRPRFAARGYPDVDAISTRSRKIFGGGDGGLPGGRLCDARKS